MAVKMKKPTRKSVPPSGEPWRPRMDSEAEFNPFAGSSAAGSHFADAAEEVASAPLPDASQDSAPLQGSMDRSDADSVVEAAGVPAAPAAPRRRATRRRPAKAKAKAKAKVSVRAKAKAKARAKTGGRRKAKTTARRRSTPRARKGAVRAKGRTAARTRGRRGRR